MRDLIPRGLCPGDGIDWPSIKELLMDGKEVLIPSFDTATRFEQSLYVERRINVPFGKQFREELAKELGCSIIEQVEQGGSIYRFGTELSVDGKGNVQCILVNNQRKVEIWGKMQIILEKRNSLLSSGTKLSGQFLNVGPIGEDVPSSYQVWLALVNPSSYRTATNGLKKAILIGGPLK